MQVHHCAIWIGLVCLCVAVSGCHTYREITFQILDFETGAPVDNLELETHYPRHFLYFFSPPPKKDSSTTNGDGMIRLRVGFGHYGGEHLIDPIHWDTPNFFHSPGSLTLDAEYKLTESYGMKYADLYWGLGITAESDFQDPVVLLISPESVIKFDQSAHWFYGTNMNN